MSHLCNYQHIVFRTYKSERTIPDLAKFVMLKYIYSLCDSHNIHVCNANAHRNHVHLLLGIPATMSIEEVVTLIKTNTAKVFKGHRLFPDFKGWGKKYGSFSVSYSHVDVVKDYIANQEKHHEGTSFYEEFLRIVERNGGVINQYFEQDFGKDDPETDYV